MNTALVLPAEITIYVVSDLRAAWLAWMDGLADDEAEVAVDGQAVEEADAAGLQALLALSHSLQARHQRLRLHPASDTLRRACGRLGLAHLLAHPLAEPERACA